MYQKGKEFWKDGAVKKDQSNDLYGAGTEVGV